MNLLRRRSPVNDQPAPRRVPVTRALLVNGSLQTIGELRSAYSNGVRMVANTPGILSGDYTPEELGNAYKTGLTTFIGVNVRCGIDAEIPVRVVDCYDNPVEDSPAQAFIKNAPQLIWRLMAHNIIWGERYIHKLYNKYGKPSGLEILSPLDVEPEIDYSRGVVRRYRVQRAWGMEYFSPDEMIVDLTFNPFSSVDGTAPIEPAKTRSDIETNIGRYGATFFANSARPDLIITTETEMSAEETKAAKESYANSFKGVLNSFRVWFAGGDKYTVTNVSTNPVDLAMVDLTNQADVKILAAIRVNPVLAGLGNASDPLSAQGTYESVRRQHVDFVAIPDVRQICNMLNEQWLHCDFENGADRFRLEPDVSAIQSDSLGTGERVTTATAAVTNGVWTVNEARKYTGKEPQPFAISVNPDWSINAYNAGLLTHRQAVLALGYEPQTVQAKELYIWDRDPRAKAPAQQPPAFGMSQPNYLPQPVQQQRSIEAVQPKMIDVVPVKQIVSGPESCYVILSLANNTAITAIQAELRAKYPDIEWAAPDSFHVTLVHSPKTADIQAVTNILPKSINSFEFEVGPISSFDSPDKIPVILKVKAPITLVALQAGLASSFEALGLTLSDHSDPNDWNPHVTLGYAPAGSELPTGDTTAAVSSSTLICSVEKGQSFQTIYVTRSNVTVNAQVEELRLWAKKVKQHGSGARFSAEIIPTPVVSFVRSALAEGWSGGSVFEAAKVWVRANEPQQMGITPEIAQDYWKDYDGLQSDIREAWLTDYMAKVWESVRPQLREGITDGEIQQLLSQYHNELTEAWIGTLDNPGALLALTIAGMQAGNKALSTGNAARPQRAALAVSWDVLSREALDFVQQYSFDLIKGIDNTTVGLMRQSISDGLTNGQSFDQIAQQIDGIFHDLDRSRVIAGNESLRVYNAGAFARWQNAGVTKAKWVTVNDSHICPVCRRLNGQVSDIATGWTDPATGLVYRELAHVGCRCPKAPVLQ